MPRATASGTRLSTVAICPATLNIPTSDSVRAAPTVSVIIHPVAAAPTIVRYVGILFLKAAPITNSDSAISTSPMVHNQKASPTNAQTQAAIVYRTIAPSMSLGGGHTKRRTATAGIRNDNMKLERLGLCIPRRYALNTFDSVIGTIARP